MHLILILGAIIAAPIEAWEAARISFNQQRVPNEMRAKSLWAQACTKGHEPSCTFTHIGKDSWVSEQCDKNDPLACTIQTWLTTQHPNSSGTIHEDAPVTQAVHQRQDKSCAQDPFACFYVLPSSPNHEQAIQTIQTNCADGHNPSCIRQAQRMLDVDPQAPKAKSILFENCSALSPQACTYLAGIYINQKQYSAAEKVLEISCSSLHTVGCRLLGLQKIADRDSPRSIATF